MSTTKCLFNILKAQGTGLRLSALGHNVRLIHTSSVACSNVSSGRVKRSLKGDKPVTYEVAYPPNHIAHRKSWNSWNTSTVEGGLRMPETVFDDVFIRKFITGTFIGMVMSEVIIKRQHNIIRIAMILLPKLSPTKLMFLIGYTEELLGHWLQCPVKLEIQTVGSSLDVVYKYV